MNYKPQYGGSIATTFLPQFPLEKLDRTSLAIAPIFQLSNDGLDSVIGHGTGFVYSRDGQFFFVTARHVVTGKGVFTDELLSSSGFVPRNFRFYVRALSPDNLVTITTVVCKLSDDERSPWLGDPEFRSLRTDIAMFPLNMHFNGANLFSIAESAEDSQIVTAVGSDLAIPGYPTAEVGGELMTPIWRRGMLASEPLLAIDNRPMFLVDAATGPGFSGAPVLRRHFGPIPLRQVDGSINILAERVVTTSLVGVYAGRLAHKHFGNEIPYAYYANRLSITAGSGETIS